MNELRLTFLSAVASSERVKLAMACVLSSLSWRSAYSRTLAMMKSENCTLSPGSPALMTALGSILSQQGDRRLQKV